MARLPKDGEYDWGKVLNDFLLVGHNPDGTIKPTSPASSPLDEPSGSVNNGSLRGGLGGLPLFNVESYGAVGDGVTDDYAAILAAWNDMLLSKTGGLVLFPRPVVYRVDADVPGRLAADKAGTYALFGLPLVATSSTDSQLTYGVLGVGSSYSPGNLSGDAAPTATSSVLYVDYANSFSWSAANGLPSVFGAPDKDKGVAGGDRSQTNLSFVATGLTVRQPNNPSLCGMNLESCACAYVGSVAFDVNVSLDSIAEPTNPTGAALLMPATNNSIACKVESFLSIGHYAGLPFAEHVDVDSAIVLLSKIAVSFRRSAVNFAHINTLSIQQCPWGFAGYDPSVGVVAVPDRCTAKIDFCDIEDNSEGGAVAWSYAPTVGAHFYDPANALYGMAWVSRNDVDAANVTDSMLVTGASNFSLWGLFSFTMTGSERIDASSHNPEN